MNVKVVIILMSLALILCKDLSENERATRAAFVQRLLNSNKYLEGRIKLVGGSNKYEGSLKFLFSHFSFFKYISMYEDRLRRSMKHGNDQVVNKKKSIEWILDSELFFKCSLKFYV